MPHRKVGPTYNECIVPGWNDFIADKHGEAREAYLNWLAAGKPRPHFDNMMCSRARFKLAFRYCKQHQEMVQANAFSEQLSGKNYNKCWNDIKKHNNGRSTKYVSSVGGCTGDDVIAEMWKCHFQDLYNSVPVDQAKDSLLTRLNDLNNDKIHVIEVEDINRAC